MRLRWRLSLKVVGVACLLNIILLGAYYGIFVYRNMEADYVRLREDLSHRANAVAQELEAGADAEDAISAYAQNGVRITLSREDGTLLMDSLNGADMNPYTISVMAPVRLNDGLYFVETAQVTDAVEQGRNMINTLLWGELIILPVVLIVMGVFLYTGYIKPLEAIQAEIKEYRRGTPLQRQNRGDEFGELHNTFVDMTERIETERQMQNRIIASISHDIKTPLTSVMGYAEQLRKPNLSPERRARYIDTIYERSTDIRNLIDEFDVYLSSHLQSTLTYSTVTAKELCSSLKMDYEEELDMRGIGFITKTSCPDCAVKIDIGKMDRVFGNIIGNSVKHIPHNRGMVAVNISQREEGMCIAIADNGEGVAEENLVRIFDALYTSDESRSVAGLGLAISKELVEAHGGSICASNRSGGGLVVTIVLPIAEEG